MDGEFDSVWAIALFFGLVLLALAIGLTEPDH